MSRRRHLQAAPEHPLDTHDTGRDHLTGAHDARTRLSAKPASTSTETGNPTRINQKGTPMSTTVITGQYHDELELIQEGRLVVTPSSLEDLRSRPNVHELRDLNGDAEGVVRKIVDRASHDKKNPARWNVEETHLLATDDGPAATSYSIDLRADGLSLEHLRYHLTTILALLPADAETYTAALAAQGE